MSKGFERRKENFVCLNCGHSVVGDGYTNHCPKCLFSRHVDINPGDRNCSCFGLMEPIAVESTGKGYIIIHKCQECGIVKRNKSAKGDSFKAILEISRREVPRG